MRLIAVEAVVAAHTPHCAPWYSSRCLRRHWPYVAAALWASAATPPRRPRTGLCTRPRAPRRCETRARRTRTKTPACQGDPAQQSDCCTPVAGPT
ncbi:hypothetical protein NDU88_005077 [Pleurodeles waltl]|uniref:Secreted protein n=1 Tax=Pleurodeles waltl TaxID=8319 RepID=A0AAV7W6V1_PLEWA|nr:hypothetical protein NDU88_005077 [Pleurodeles waltl]